ncbi:MAG: 4Fe-4S dicluster domain-containing protein [Deltaproteobacteria bacterium]|nr:4Fe-4S dicluster domain-containing protein [Deltaproteobacteria bacterium]
MDRRGFLKTSLVTGAAAFSTGKASANGTNDPGDPNEFVGILVDTTRCIGCRACEVACGEEHDMLVPDVLNDGALEEPRLTSPEQWTIVNKYETDKGDVFVKRQCMHCFQAACAAACPTEAMYKTEDGPVIWRGSKCLGCRYCMVSCPFDMPKFEYHEWNPKIQKCTMCFERLEAGEKPACVESCPTDALMFGTRVKNLEIARHRIYSHPDDLIRNTQKDSSIPCPWFFLACLPFC